MIIYYIITFINLLVVPSFYFSCQPIRKRRPLLREFMAVVAVCAVDFALFALAFRTDSASLGVTAVLVLDLIPFVFFALYVPSPWDGLLGTLWLVVVGAATLLILGSSRAMWIPFLIVVVMLGHLLIPYYLFALKPHAKRRLTLGWSMALVALAAFECAALTAVPSAGPALAGFMVVAAVLVFYGAPLLVLALFIAPPWDARLARVWLVVYFLLWVAILLIPAIKASGPVA